MQGGKEGDEKGERGAGDNLDERGNPEDGWESEQEIKEIKGGERGREEEEGESKSPAVDPAPGNCDPPVSDLANTLDLGEGQKEIFLATFEAKEGERKEKITQEVDKDEPGQENVSAQIEDEKCEDERDGEEEEDCSPRLATQLSLHEELRMSSSFANHSDNDEDDPEVRVENVEEEDEAKEEEEEGGDEGEDEDEDEEPEEEEGDPMSLFLAHKPFCGRLTSSALSKAEEFSETETYSSGFSEDYKITSFKPVHRHTQTCDRDISSPVNDLDNHFQATPRYKVIFKEIFQVLKQAKKMETANSRQDRRIRQVVWQQGNHLGLDKTPDYPATEASGRVAAKEYQRDSFKPKATLTDYSCLPPTSLSSMASMARLKQIQESYASVLRRGIHDA